jgi:hypothetical protein
LNKAGDIANVASNDAGVPTVSSVGCWGCVA